MWLGRLCVMIGVISLGLGLAFGWHGHKVEAFDGLLFGGIAFVAGLVILWRRGKMQPPTDARD